MTLVRSRGGVIPINRRFLLLTLIVVFATSIIGGYFLIVNTLLPTVAQAPVKEEPSVPKDVPKESLPKLTSLTLSAVGDIMVHIPQYQAAYNSETDSYDFSENFLEVSALIQKADLAIANLETVFAGKERGISGYPVFNTPDEMALALKNAGFDILSTANNHSLDKGEAGVLRTLQVLKELKVTPVGTNSSAEEEMKLAFKEINGIKIAFLAYSFGTNGMPIPKGKDYLVNLINLDKIKADIIKAEDLKADITVVSMHWGQEYQRQPNNQQKELAQELISMGVDIILGSHPHVIQPIEKIDLLLENGQKREGYVVYSLGNFISNQNLQTLNMKYVDSGIILSFDIEKDFSTNNTKISRVHYTPTWVHKFYKNGRNHYKVLAVEEAISNYEKGIQADLTKNDYNRLKDVLTETKEQMILIEE